MMLSEMSVEAQRKLARRLAAMFPDDALQAIQEARERSARITATDLLIVAGNVYSVSPDIICSGLRTRGVVNARRLFIHLAKSYLKWSTTEIGNYLGHADHTSVTYFLKQDIPTIDWKAAQRSITEALRGH